jgi:hypothetical protein
MVIWLAGEAISVAAARLSAVCCRHLMIVASWAVMRHRTFSLAVLTVPKINIQIFVIFYLEAVFRTSHFFVTLGCSLCLILTKSAGRDNSLVWNFHKFYIKS